MGNIPTLRWEIAAPNQTSAVHGESQSRLAAPTAPTPKIITHLVEKAKAKPWGGNARDHAGRLAFLRYNFAQNDHRLAEGKRWLAENPLRI